MLENFYCQVETFLLLRGDEEITSQDVFKLCFKLTTDSTIQWFQYRILHRILPFKNYLKKMKITDNDSCTFCGNDTETIEHIFATCTFTLALWNQFSLFIMLPPKDLNLMYPILFLESVHYKKQTK